MESFVLWSVLLHGLFLQESSLQHTHASGFSLTQPFHSHFTMYGGWSTLGTAMATDEYVILTRDQPSQKGSIWLQKSVPYRNWKAVINFKVNGNGANFYGDGFAFWYISQHSKPGPIFGSHDYFMGLGVMFDTYSNHQDLHKHAHPYISAQINDGTVHYDHDQDGTHSQLAGCSYNFRGGDLFTAEIAYYGSNGTLMVLMRKTDEPDLYSSCIYATGVQLPTNYFMGLSSATGDLSDDHQIYGIKFYDMDSVLKAQYGSDEFDKLIPTAKYSAPKREHSSGKPASSPTWRVFKRLLLFLTLLGFTTLALIVFFAYLNKRKREKMKRFY